MQVQSFSISTRILLILVFLAITARYSHTQDNNGRNYFKYLIKKNVQKQKQFQVRRLTTTTTTVSTQLKYVERFKNLAHFEDADLRGPQWYDYEKSGSKGRSSEGSNPNDETLSSGSLNENKKRYKEPKAPIESEEESSLETRKSQRYRQCLPCPEDMVKRFTNLGIKWICGGYHRARRSFKSTCMMKFRNCQDGTMFVKMYNQRCSDNIFHGKHFFYQYPV